MDKIRKSYSLAKTKNVARFDSLLQNEDISTTLFVSKYGSIKQGFLSDYINDNIKDETFVMNFMYFSELYNDGKEYDIGAHFEKQLNIYKESRNIKAETKIEEEKEEEVVEKKSKLFESFILFIDGIVLGLVNYFILGTLDIATYLPILEGKEQMVEYGVYALAGLFIFAGFLLLVTSGKKKKVKKKSKKKQGKKPAVESKKTDDIVIDESNSIHTITQRKTNTRDLHQTQSLDFSKMIGKKENSYEFDLNITDKKYFVLYGLDEYVHFVKTKSNDSAKMIKHVSDFMIKVYSTFKKHKDKKLIFVWKDRVFINQDLTLLIFDEVFTLYGDFDEIELENHVVSVFDQYNFVVDAPIRNEICSRVNYLTDIDTLGKEMAGVAEFIDCEIDANKLAYIQFLKVFDEKKIAALQKYFSENDKVVDVKHFTLSKNEFELYFTGSPKIINEDNATLSADSDYLDYADLIINDVDSNIGYKIKDDYVKLEEFIESVPNHDLHLFVNIDILDYLLSKKGGSELLAEKIIYSLLNLDADNFKRKFKVLFNILAKSSVEDESVDYSKIVEAIIIIMLAVERRKMLECMYEIPEKYIANNRRTAVMMVRHINKNIGSYSVFRKNEVLINYLLDEAIPNNK